MASIVVSGDTSGAITISAPATAGTNTLSLPANTGTAILDYSTPAYRNRIINGAMVIDQRATAVTTSNWTVDRFYYNTNVASKGTAQQSTSVYPTGYKASLGFTSSSAYSLGASEYFGFQQPIEGLNVVDLAWGTASASSVTISFWVYSSLTGTFGGSLRNSAANRSYVFSYTVSSANTWEQKTVTIIGDTTGTWLTTNGVGIFVNFSIGQGSTYSGTSGSWAGANYTGPTGQTSVVGTNGATFYITGVQLEKGSTATSFDYRPYGTELALCQRYYTYIGGNSGNGIPVIRGYATAGVEVGNNQFFQVTMRASPTVTVAGTFSYTNCASLSAGNATPQGFEIWTAASGTGAVLLYGNSSDDRINASAEL